MIENAPFRDVLTDSAGRMSGAWMRWVQKIGLFAGSESDHGTTAQRPTSDLYIGRPFFDDTLGHKIWVKTVSPVVWVDGVGNSV